MSSHRRNSQPVVYGSWELVNKYPWVEQLRGIFYRGSQRSPSAVIRYPSLAYILIPYLLLSWIISPRNYPHSNQDLLRGNPIMTYFHESIKTFILYTFPRGYCPKIKIQKSHFCLLRYQVLWKRCQSSCLDFWLFSPRDFNSWGGFQNPWKQWGYNLHGTD